MQLVRLFDAALQCCTLRPPPRQTLTLPPAAPPLVHCAAESADAEGSPAAVVREAVGRRLDELDSSFLTTLDAYIQGAADKDAHDVAGAQRRCAAPLPLPPCAAGAARVCACSPIRCVYRAIGIAGAASFLPSTVLTALPDCSACPQRCC